MPFDPDWPQNGQNIDADKFREQFTSLLAESSANTNNVDTLNMNAEPNYEQNQIQAILQKLDEVILALRR
ncbi:MAG: hypothetical protein JNJ83_07730 [Verrucomicrobiaceae bacterium]|nr:hypothetical protein [Verrucomicrobiaceae bacterium]